MTEPLSSRFLLDAVLATPSCCNNHELRKATRHLGQLFDDVIGASGLRGGQYAILVHVEAMDGPTMKQLAQKLVMDLSALGHTLKPLTRDGYLRLDKDECDARAKRVRLTDEGRTKLAQSIELWRVAQTRCETALGPERALAMREMLAVVASDAFADAFRGTTPLR